MGSWYGVFRVLQLMKMPSYLFALIDMAPTFFARRPAFARLMLLACLTVNPWVAPIVNALEGAAETEIKAAMLYKFLGYIDWPTTSFADIKAPYRLTVFRAKPLSDELKILTAGREANGRSIQVLHTNSVGRLSRADVEKPHILFVGRDAENYLPALTKLAVEHSFLIVTESEKGLPQGSTINLRLDRGRIGFDVSLPDANKKNLKLSSRLLSVALSVEQGAE